MVFIFCATFSLVIYVVQFMLYYHVEDNYILYYLPKCKAHDDESTIIFQNIVEAVHRFGMIDFMLLPLTVIFFKSN